MMHWEIDDLPPAMKKQALKILAGEDARRKAALKNAARAKALDAKANGESFGSRGEYEYYISVIRPKLKSGEIVKCTKQPEYELFPQGEYRGEKLRRIRYTADFLLEHKDGTVEIVEVKSRFVKRMQRDYHIRRRIFIEKYARPNGWIFTEVITDDTKEDIEAWKGAGE